jgi:alkylhydroperoxidase family enzyme
MLLRASGQREDKTYNLNSITDTALTAGVDDEQHLRQLTEAAISGDWLNLQKHLQAAEKAMGYQQAIDTLVVAAAFNGITRVADATGIPLDRNTAETTIEMRAATGIQQFEYAQKSERYG